MRASKILQLYFRDKFSYFYLPWIIVILSFLVNLVIGILLKNNEGIYSGGVISIYIYMFVIGITALSQMFHFSLGLNVRRTDFFNGTVQYFVLFSAIAAVALTILSVIELRTVNWGVNVYFFDLPYVNDGSLLEQWLTNFILMLDFIAAGLIISSVFRRFGKNGLYTLFIVLFLLLSIGIYLTTYYQWWVDIFQWVSRYTMFELTLWTLPGLIILFLLSYHLIRRSEVQ